MADITPFKGTLYNPEKIKDLSKVVAPPYDVISPEEQDGLYNSEPHNIIRVLFGKDLPQDNDNENKYTRAAGFLKEWQEKEILKTNGESCIYTYLQEFTIDGRTKKRLGFIALLKLEDFDSEGTSVYPHENTFALPKEDRTRLISSIGANLGPIFALFADEDKSIDVILSQQSNSHPIIDIMDHHGIRNKLWRISDKNTVEKIVRLMKDKKLFIADGHHRYEVGLAFSKIKKDSKYGYILTYFTDLCADGVVVLPVHRLISGISGDVLSGLEKDLGKDFTFEKLASQEEARSFLSGAILPEKRFVMYYGRKFTGLRLDNGDSLDVTVVHDLIINPLEERIKRESGNISIDFTKDMDYAVKEVNAGRFSLSVLLNPTGITEVRDMAFSGRRMPQKSTYFYPKVLTGLVVNVF